MRKRNLVTIALLSLIVLFFIFTNGGFRSGIALNKGNEYYYKQMYDEAIEQYSKAIGLNPNNSWAYYNRGISYKAKGNFDQAISDYTQAIRLNFTYAANAYISRGDAYGAKGNRDQALSDLNKAIGANRGHARVKGRQVVSFLDNIASNFVLYILILGIVFFGVLGFAIFFKVNSDRGASRACLNDLDALDKWIEQGFSKTDLAIRLQKLRSKYGFKEVNNIYLVKLTEAIKQRPDYWKNYYVRADVYMLTDKDEKAIPDLTKVISLNPGFEDAYYCRSSAYFNIEDYDSAYADAMKAQEYIMKLDPELFKDIEKAK